MVIFSHPSESHSLQQCVNIRLKLNKNRYNAKKPKYVGSMPFFFSFNTKSTMLQELEEKEQ